MSRRDLAHTKLGLGAAISCLAGTWLTRSWGWALLSHVSPGLGSHEAGAGRCYLMSRRDLAHTKLGLGSAMACLAGTWLTRSWGWALLWHVSPGLGSHEAGAGLCYGMSRRDLAHTKLGLGS